MKHTIYKNTPLWWDDADLDHGVEQHPAVDLPAQADVVIVGAGYTGLTAAMSLARAGRDVVVLDSEKVGFGCSSRNGGLIGPSFHKLGLAGLTAAYGSERAREIMQESMDSLDFLKNLIREEQIECDLSISGRFRGAISPEAYETNVRDTEELHKKVGLRYQVVPKSEQHNYIGSDEYHGGIYLPDDGYLQPAKLSLGLAQCAVSAGARIHAPAHVTAIENTGNKKIVKVGPHQLKAREVLIATNGYTGPELPWHRRRVIPLRSAIIATEPVENSVMRSMTPQGMGFMDASRLVLYYRPSPDGRRMVFGGRAFNRHDKPENYTRDLYRIMTRIFPQLKGTEISHAWSGTVAYTFDHAPHVGQYEGVYYSMGYCGSGVGRACYFGNKVAHKILGSSEGHTSLDELPFKGRPLYSGNPWFMPAIIRWNSLMDQLGR